LGRAPLFAYCTKQAFVTYNTKASLVESDNLAGMSVIRVTCPPRTSPVFMLDWRIREKGVTDGQEGMLWVYD